MKILMPTKGRAGKCLTMKLVPSAIIVCSKKESEAYAKAYPKNDILVEPDNVNDIVKCRAWLLEKFRKTDDIFMIDDDLQRVMRNFSTTGHLADASVKDPDEILEILKNTQFVAEQLGCYLWGYANIVNPVQFTGHDLISLSGYLNNSYMGFRKGHNLKYNINMKEGEDHFICCLNKHLNRIHVRDKRWAFKTSENFKADGGCQGYRNTREMLKTTRYLQKLFGSDIVQQKQQTNVKKSVHQGERSIYLPY